MTIKLSALALVLLLCGIAFCSEEVDYKKAYEESLGIIDKLQAEIKNLEGLVEYYKGELSKLNNPPEIIDYSYNDAANRLWASAWNLQHDAVFKKSGKEKEEYLYRAVDTYKRIVIDYPYSNKAEEAQYRIGRIYYKFIKDYKLADVELQKYVDMYPKGRFTSEARELLDRMRK